MLFPIPIPIQARWLALFSQNLAALIDFAWLGPLLIGVVFADKIFIRYFWQLLLFGLVNLGLTSLTWAIIPEPERTLQAAYIALLLISLRGLSRIRSRTITAGVIIITITGYLILDIHRINWARKDIPNHRFAENRAVIDWLKTNTQPDDIIVSPDPWTINYATGRPALILPRDLNQDNLTEFLNRYQPGLFLLPSESSLIPLLPSESVYFIN